MSIPCEDAATRNPGRGFSLLELVLVIVIIATLAGLAIPRMTASATHARADQAVDRIERVLEESRAWARTRSGMAEIEFLTGSDEIRRKHDGKDQTLIVMSASPYQADITGASFAGDNKFLIDGWGEPSAAGTITITVGKVQRTVTIPGPMLEGRASSSTGLDLTRPSSLETLIAKMGITP